MQDTLTYALPGREAFAALRFTEAYMKRFPLDPPTIHVTGMMHHAATDGTPLLLQLYISFNSQGCSFQCEVFRQGVGNHHFWQHMPELREHFSVELDKHFQFHVEAYTPERRQDHNLFEFVTNVFCAIYQNLPHEFHVKNSANVYERQWQNLIDSLSTMEAEMILR